MSEYQVTAYVNVGDNNFRGFTPAAPIAKVDDFTITDCESAESAANEFWLVGNKQDSDDTDKGWPGDVRSLSVGDLLGIKGEEGTTFFRRRQFRLDRDTRTHQSHRCAGWNHRNGPRSTGGITMFGRERSARTLDGIDYAPGAQFRVVKAGAKLSGMKPERGGFGGWLQDLQVGDVLTCTGFGAGWGSDPGFGVEFTTEQSIADGAIHCDVYPRTGGVFAYRLRPEYLEAIS